MAARPNYRGWMLVVAVVVLMTAGWGEGADESGAAVVKPKPYKKSKLSYYVQVVRGHPSMGILLKPLNSSYNHGMGFTTIFALNMTQTKANTSRPLGVARGYTVNTAYASDTEYAGFETEIISYDDGEYKGTIHFQAMLDGSSAEVAILGGTGSFRSVRGWGTVTQTLLQLPYVVYFHKLHFVR
ncbi:hypothetical protein L7F22_017341 [Adiantum nelumboides]|nr:hypothetical protein [Adiantum nelumboides]